MTEPSTTPTGDPRMRTDVVSVVIPTYNRAHIVGRAIDSVLAQDYRHIEIVVVDDGSRDDTRAVVERYGDPVRYIRQDNGGVSRARNTAMDAATGEFIAFLDSDDVWMPWKLRAQVTFLRQFPQCGMVWTDMSAVDPSGITVAPRYLRTMYGAYRKTSLERWIKPIGMLADLRVPLPEKMLDCPIWSGNMFTAMFFGNMVHTSTVLLRREWQQRVGHFDESLRTSGEDYDFHWRTTRLGDVGFLDAPSVLYRIDAADQLTSPEFGAQVARNNLLTLEKQLASDRVSLRLSDSEIRRRLADADAWLGEEASLAGDRQTARRHLARSLGLVPWQPMRAVALLLNLLPPSLLVTLRRFSRSLRR